MQNTASSSPNREVTREDMDKYLHDVASTLNIPVDILTSLYQKYNNKSISLTILNEPIDNLFEGGNRHSKIILRILRKETITKVSDILNLSEIDILRFPGMGEKRYKILNERFLKRFGFPL